MGRIKGKPATWIDLGFKAHTIELMRQDSELKELTPADEEEFKKLSRRYFENKNVYDNRELAQRIGVESATTLPKQDLIDRLLDKVWGVQYFSSKFNNIKDIEIGKMEADIELALLEDVKKGDVIIGEEMDGIFEAKAEGGILWKADGHFDKSLDTFVLRNLTGEFGLRDGDRIKGRVRFVDKLGYYCMFHIDEINGVVVSDNGRPSVNTKQVAPSIKLEMKSNSKLVTGLQLFAPVCYGQFGVVSANGRVDFCEKAISIFESLNNAEIDSHLFLLEEKGYVVEQVKERFGECENVHYSVLGERKVNELLKYMQYASAQARYNGARHVVIISDLDMLDRTESENGLTAKQLASYAGVYSNGGSVTVIAMAETNSPFSAYHVVRNRLDFELALKSSMSVTKNVIDMLSSYSISNRFVSKEEMIAIAKLQQIAVSEGNNAVERRLSGCVDADEIILQLND